MLILLDTEFTSLLEPELLSIGMVTSGEPALEFYGEVDLQSSHGQGLVRRASAMVRECVLPQWGKVYGCAGTPWEVGRRAGEWLLHLHEHRAMVDPNQGHRLEIGYDYPTDYELLQLAIRGAGLWDRVQSVVRPVMVASFAGSLEAALAAEECFMQLRSRGLQRHHALADALALRAGVPGGEGTTGQCVRARRERSRRLPQRIDRVNKRVVERVLFLDFDGVLHPAPDRGLGSYSSVVPFQWVGYLVSVLQTHPDVEIVVHSSWRLVHSLEEISDMLADLGDRHVSLTPEGEKHDSILAWLRVHRVRSFAILDDQPEEFARPLFGNLMVCKPGLGVSDPAVLCELANWLNN